MEGGGWRPTGQGEAMVDPGVVDWRSQLQYDARQRIVNKIMETLKRHLSVPVPEGFAELKKIAVRFEEKIYAAATNQSDYLRKISLKMLSMETKTQNAATVNPSSSNLVGSQSTADSALLGIQSQIGNQGQSLAMVNQSPARQSLLPQNVPNNAPSTSIQNSAGLPAPMSSISGITQPAMSHIGPNSNLQNVSSMPQSSINSVAGQGATPNIYANTQRQMQGRTQPPSIVSQQHQQQSQNPLIYTQQFQQQMLNQKLTHPSLAQPHLQQQQQQQQPSLLQQNQLQSSQQSLVQMASSIPAGQSNIQQAQPTVLQTMQKSSLQNQQNPMQQSSLLHQHPQSIVRQQQSQPTHHQQPTSFQQQASSVPQQSILSSQQQQLMGQQSNMLTMQHNQLLGQQNNVTDLQQQQQRMPGQQNNLLSVKQPQQMLNQQSISLQQQQLGTENNLSGQQQQQQSQLLGSQPGISNMQPHQRSLQMLQQNKTVIPQTHQPSLAMLQSQNQQSQHPSSQQQLMPQIPSQPGQLQPQLGMQQQTGSMQREMQQRLQTSGALLQSQNAIEQQKQFIQPQRGLPEVSSSATLDSTVPTNNTGVVDWQEETYQKIKSLKELYYVELQELNQKIALKFQQHESLLSAPKQSEPFEKLKNYKMVLERTLAFFQIAKANIQPGLKEKLPLYEKQILNFLASSRGQKNVPSHSSSQLQFQHSSGQPHGGHSQSTLQRSSQVSPIQQNDNMNQVHQMNLQGSATAMQPSASANMPHGSLPLSTVSVSTTQPSIMNPLQSTPNIDAMQGSSYGSLQQASVNSAQQSIGASPQNTMSVTQQNNIHTLPQNSNTLQPNINSMQPTTNILQQQHLKQQQEQQQQQLMQSQQMKQQLQHRHIQQQIMQQQQKQQILQQQPAMQQQLLQQQKQQQAAQLPVNQLAQHQINEEMKLRQGAGIKSGLYQQHFQAGQRLNYHHQQQKAGSSLPSSSPQNIQTSSPQISQHPSPQIDQHSLLSSLPKTGTPLQATNSPFVPSPSTPIAPSPVPVDSEKAHSGIALPTSAVSSGSQQTNLNPPQSSIAVGTPGISASPLLAEFVSPDAHQPNGPVFLGKRGVTEKPLEHLIKVIQSVPPEVLSSSVSDIGSVINMTDRIAGSAPGNGSRSAVGEDLVAMTKCRLQARNFMSQDGSAITKKMKRHISAMPLNVVPSDGRVENTFRQSDNLEKCELESTAAYSIKRQKNEVNHALREEIREINKKLIDTVVSVSEEDVDSVSVASVGSGEGTVIKCSYSAVALSPSLKLHFASAQVSPILPLKLLLPPSYPKCSPILLDGLPVEPSQDFEDLSTKAKLRFSTSLRRLQQPISLREMARTWDVCTRKVISEYAQQSGGGVFSSKYGAWENCVGA